MKYNQHYIAYQEIDTNTHNFWVNNDMARKYKYSAHNMKDSIQIKQNDREVKTKNNYNIILEMY